MDISSDRTVSIKSDHPLKGFKKHQVLDSHESPERGRKLIDTYFYEVPEERAEEAQTLGGELA